MKLNQRESQVFESVIAAGWACLRNGWPDFTIISPKGEVAFIEVKRPHDVLSDSQKQMGTLLMRLGFKVYISDGNSLDPMPEFEVAAGKYLIDKCRAKYSEALEFSETEREADIKRICAMREILDAAPSPNPVESEKRAYMASPRLLDLFCGAGGCSVGYSRAGFDCYGIDNDPKPLRHYPFPHICMDALEAMDRLLKGEGLTFTNGETLYLADFSAFHASPPCQRWARGHNAYRLKYPDCVTPIRERLIATGKPWVIENVPGAPVRADFSITGDMVGLPQLVRERHFETNWWNGLAMVSKCERSWPSICVTGTGTPTGTYKAFGRALKLKEFQRAMGIDWMVRHEMSEAIPPAYMEHIIGKYLMQAVLNEVAA